jgi:hypothetical protein
MIIKTRGSNLFDVFYGRDGFYDWEWACFLKQRGRLILVKGSPVPSPVYSEIYKQVIGK